jgi:hypothetical protein
MLQMNLVVQVNLAIEIGKETINSPFFHTCCSVSEVNIHTRNRILIPGMVDLMADTFLTTVNLTMQWYAEL